MLEIVVLAAGASRRLGNSKQLLAINGQSLVYRAAKTASELAALFQLNQPLVIVGKDQKEVRLQITNLPVRGVYNPRWQDGMGFSIATAVENLNADGSAVLLLTCDQVLLTTAALKPLLQKWQANPEHIIASTYSGITGIPVIFPKRFFPDLVDLNSDKGAREVLQKYQHKVIEFDLPIAAQDLDCKEDELIIRIMPVGGI